MEDLTLKAGDKVIYQPQNKEFLHWKAIARIGKAGKVTHISSCRARVFFPSERIYRTIKLSDLKRSGHHLTTIFQ